MTYPVTRLITGAYYLSGVVPKGIKTVTGSQLTEGLDLLNELLDFKTADQRLIPYFNDYDFNAVPGVGKYFIPNLVFTEILTFSIGSVRFSTNSEGRRLFLGSSRANNINSLPYKWHVERCLKGSNLFIYFQPDTNYPMKIWGKFSLTDVELNQDLLLIYDKYYIAYLRYALAKYICQEYSISFPIANKEQLLEFEYILTDISPMDLTPIKRNMFSKNTGINYGIANISNGFI